MSNVEYRMPASRHVLPFRLSFVDALTGGRRRRRPGPGLSLLILLALSGPAGRALAAESALPESSALRTEPPDLSTHGVVLMFDDGWQSVYSEAFPLLRANRMVASLALISNVIGGGKVRYIGGRGGYMNRAEIQEMIDTLGVEIVSHSQTHPFLTRLSDDDVRQELTDSRKALEVMFRANVDFFVYPYGDMDGRVRDLVAKAGYELARSINPGPMDFERRRFSLPATEVRQSTSLDNIKREVARRPELVLFFHRILPKPTTYTEWSVNEFAGLLDWLETNGVQVVTLGDLYDSHRGKSEPIAKRSRWKYRIEWDLLQEVDVDVTWAAERR